MISLFGEDPGGWPIIGSVYRCVNWADASVIYTTCRYENTHGYVLARRESDHYCYCCGTSVSGGFGAIMYTRKDGCITVPIYICAGCPVPTLHEYCDVLSWYDESIETMMGKMGRDPPELLDIVNEMLTTMQLRTYVQLVSILIPPEFTALYRFAKKL